MTKLKIDDGTTHGVYGDTLPQWPDRPEPPRRDPALDRITRRALMAKLGWTEQIFDQANVFGFPKAIGRYLRGLGVANDLEPFWDMKQVEKWLVETNAFVAAAKLARWKK